MDCSYKRAKDQQSHVLCFALSGLHQTPKYYAYLRFYLCHEQPRTQTGSAAVFCSYSALF